MTHIAVIDIGKTNAKLALVDSETLVELAVVRRTNTVHPGPPWPHFDLEGHWGFLLKGLTAFHAEYDVDAISITAHGASCVLLDKDGGLAAPMLDYEHTGPNDLAADYDRIRPDFRDTGSARLAGGLNVGAQLHWMFAQDPGLHARTAQILTYPQYWAFRLTGVPATERTSLGCHTDLWEPDADHVSNLAYHLGVADKLAPIYLATDVLGEVTPDLCQQTGLPPETPVTCGIHDSNASLLPHLMTRDAPFSVVSTGTWVVAMTIDGAPVTLAPGRDTLLNVNAYGAPVPSARFMGGREFEVIIGDASATPTAGDVEIVLKQKPLLLPSVTPTTGPFQGRIHTWSPSEPEVGTGLRSIITSYYLALVTSECLSLTGHRGEILVEGPFAENRAYLEMLAAATDCPVLATGSATGTSQGAALLVTGPVALAPLADTILPDTLPPELEAYAAHWRNAVNSA